jgi:ATP-dependent helicase/nuclease subunit A
MKEELTPQQKSALVYNRHISLTANAGSGKTFVLSKRFVEIFLNEDIDLSSIVAITFTDKAAGELNRKIAREVDEKIIFEEDKTRLKRLENLRRQLVSANISTIHSFCINILKEFAPEAEIDANFVPVNQETANEMIELCIEEAINHCIRTEEYKENLKYLIRFFGSKSNFISQLKYSIAKRDIIQKLSDSIFNKSESEISVFFREKFDFDFNRSFGTKIELLADTVNQINNIVLKQNGKSSIPNDIAGKSSLFKSELTPLGIISIIIEIRNLMLTKAGTIRSKGYLSKERDEYPDLITYVENGFAELNNFFSISEPEKSEQELAHFGKIFILIYSYVNNLYITKKKQKGFLDFEDLLLNTQKILKLESVKNYLSGRFKYIMIDEYQDTNELQYRIFMPILNYLKSGNLFVVGDEKQSIYSFRNADLEIFEKTKNDIKSFSENGQLLSLPHSFRMSPQLILFTNYLFTKLFKEPDAFFNEVSYNKLICAKDDSEYGAVEILIAEDETENSESNLTAKRILQLVSEDKNEPVLFKDIAVLCRKRSSFIELEESFVKYNIPYSIIGGKAFYQRQTIYDIYNYLAFLLNVEDDNALIGILRSPFFNLSDLQLYHISKIEGNTFFEKLLNTSKINEEINLIQQKLNQNIKIAFSMEIYSLIRKILLESGYWAVIACKRNSSQELVNIEKLLVIARGFSKNSFMNLYDFTVYLKDSILNYSDEGQAQVTKEETAVKILTIHQAKGLEFKAVFLYGCNQKSNSDAVKAKTLSIDKTYGILSKTPLNNDYFEDYSIAPIAAMYDYSIRRKNSAEIKRLLYVAVTRAINYLFITTFSNNKNMKDSFFDLFINGLELDLNTEKVSISEDVEFMKAGTGGYTFNKKPVSLTIPIIKTIDEEIKAADNQSNAFTAKRILINTINDLTENEIISATKISMYSQCPVKYQLTYELGYSTIFKIVKTKEMDFEFNMIEDDEIKKYAQLRGKIIHAVLKNDLKNDAMYNFIFNTISVEEALTGKSIELFVRTIIDDIEQYYKSNAYNEIISLKNFKNEYEIYCREGNHYLYGIVDKLIIEQDKLTIIDYKTDNVSFENLSERSKEYLPQLMFYAYVLSKHYSKIEKYSLRLVFLKHADEVIVKEISFSELINFGKIIRESIAKIYTYDFIPNLDHCARCHFALEGNKCIKTNL